MGDHINAEGEFTSDKYAWCKPGFVPLKLTDPMAQPLLWTYASVRASVDHGFCDDLRTCLIAKGYTPPSAPVARVTDEEPAEVARLAALVKTSIHDRQDPLAVTVARSLLEDAAPRFAAEVTALRSDIGACERALQQEAYERDVAVKSYEHEHAKLDALREKARTLGEEADDCEDAGSLFDAIKSFCAMSKQIVGQCWNCGGQVTVPRVFMSVNSPVPTCESCGATAKPSGPVIEMNLPKRHKHHCGECCHAEKGGDT